MISTQQQSNLAKTAIFMLLDTTVEFKMQSYFSNKSDWVPEVKEYACGTSCCLAGYGPVALKNGSTGQSWDHYIHHTFGGNNDDVWNFLFDSGWPDDRAEAASRVIFFLRDQAEGGRQLKEWSEDEDYDLRFDTVEPAKQLIEQLEKFIIE